MFTPNNLDELPSDLPAPTDDGACDHLRGASMPSIALPATDGAVVDLAALPGRSVVFTYPRTGQPGLPPLIANWNQVPGARGCTPQTAGYRDRFEAFRAINARVFGLSTQTTAYQREMVDRLHVPFPVLSDADLALTTALRLPTFEAAGATLLKRMAWVIDDGVITAVFYPVFPPDKSAEVVLDWLRTPPLSPG